MKLVFCKKGKNDNSYVLLDTEKKHFKYFTGTWDYPKTIYVQTKKDLDIIMDDAKNDGYALKIGGI